MKMCWCFFFFFWGVIGLLAEVWIWRQWWMADDNVGDLFFSGASKVGGGPVMVAGEHVLVFCFNFLGN